MFTLILVPLDGSPLAAGALPYAAALARLSGARLLLVRASLVRLPPPPDTYEARLVADEGAYLERTAGLLREQGVDVETALRYADPAETLVDEARTRGADLIAMTSRGHGGLGRLVFGSVAAAVVERAPAPVLLLTKEADAEHESAPFGSAPRLLVPLVGSPPPRRRSRRRTTWRRSSGAGWCCSALSRRTHGLPGRQRNGARRAARP